MSKTIYSTARIPKRAVISHLPDDVLANIYSHLIIPRQPCHLYHVKHAVLFALTSRRFLSIFQPLFTRITFPSTLRFFGHLCEPTFLASLVTLAAKSLLHLQLPQIDPTPALISARVACINLESLAFFDFGPRKESLFHDLILRCKNLKSITIHHVTTLTLCQLTDAAKAAQLTPLTHIALHHIIDWQVSDVVALLVTLSNQLQHITLETQSYASIDDPFPRLVLKIVEAFPSMTQLQSLRLLQHSTAFLRLHHECAEPLFRSIAHVIDFLGLRSAIADARSLKKLQIVCSHSRALLALKRLHPIASSAEVTLDMTGPTVITTAPVLTVTAAPLGVLSSFFSNDLARYLSPTRLDLGSYVDIVAILNRLKDRSGAQQGYKTEVLFEKVRTLSVRVQPQKASNLEPYSNALLAVLRKLKSLDSFEMSVLVVFDMNEDAFSRVMDLVKLKSPKRIMVYTDDIAPADIAIYASSLRGEKRGASKNDLLRLDKFLAFLETMPSLREVVMEGIIMPYADRTFTLNMPKAKYREFEMATKMKKDYAMTLSKRLTKMEVQCNMDLSSVIGWLESVVLTKRIQAVPTAEKKNGSNEN